MGKKTEENHGRYTTTLSCCGCQCIGIVINWRDYKEYFNKLRETGWVDRTSGDSDIQNCPTCDKKEEY